MPGFDWSFPELCFSVMNQFSEQLHGAKGLNNGFHKLFALYWYAPCLGKMFSLETPAFLRVFAAQKHALLCGEVVVFLCAETGQCLGTGSQLKWSNLLLW